MHRALAVSVLLVVACSAASCGASGGGIGTDDLRVRDETCPVHEEVAAAYGETDLLGELKLGDADNEPASDLELGGALADGDGAYVTCSYRYLDNDEDFTVHVVRLEQAQPDVLAPAIEELALPMPDYEAEDASGFLSDEPEPVDADAVLDDLGRAGPGQAVSIEGTSLSLAEVDAGDDVLALVLVSMSDDVEDRETIAEGVAQELSD